MSKSMQNKITILALIICFPIGILLMFFWKLFSPWVRIFLSISLILVFMTLGISIWQVNKITTNLDNQIKKELNTIPQSSVSVSKTNFNLPQKDVYEKESTGWTPIIANGAQISILDFTGHTYLNKINKKSLNYCAVSFEVKNLLMEPVTIFPDSMFMLSPEGVDLNFPLAGITGLGDFETQPKETYFGEDKFELAPNNSRAGFLPFDCPDFKTSYIFQSDINQFYPEVITQELAYKALKIKMSLSNKNQSTQSSGSSSAQ